MFQSKAIKGFEEEKRSKFGELKHRVYLWWIETTVADYYYKALHTFIENPIYQTKRLCQWYLNVFGNLANHSSWNSAKCSTASIHVY